MTAPRKTAIVTGASQGIGAGIVKGFVERGFNVVANSRKVTQSAEVAASDQVALVDGHIGEPATAAKIVETALSRFKSIDALVNNAGIFFTKPFTDYTADDLSRSSRRTSRASCTSRNFAVKQMLAQKTGGSIVTITAALAAQPDRRRNGVRANDHQGWSGYDHAALGDGVCERRDPRQRRRAGRRRYAASQRRSERRDGSTVPDGVLSTVKTSWTRSCT